MFRTMIRPSSVRRSKTPGFTLVEAVLATVVLAASFLGLSYVISNTTLFNVNVDISTTAILLANERMEITKARAFADIDDVSATSFGGNFATYSYQVEVDYVDPGDLNTPVVGPTSYKRIVVTVTCINWSGQIKLYNIKTDEA